MSRCNYCKDSDGLGLFRETILGCDMEIYTDNTSSLEVGTQGGNRHNGETVRINYCPMCGRELDRLD